MNVRNLYTIVPDSIILSRQPRDGDDTIREEKFTFGNNINALYFCFYKG